jgi:hypothetical protein
MKIRTYLKDNILLDDSASANQIAHLAKRYILVEGDLYRHGANGVLMRCITRKEGCELLIEVHEDECGNHASSRTLVPAREGSDTATRLVAPNPASPCGGLRCCHVFHGTQQPMGYGNK